MQEAQNKMVHRSASSDDFCPPQAFLQRTEPANFVNLNRRRARVHMVDSVEFSVVTLTSTPSCVVSDALSVGCPSDLDDGRSSNDQPGARGNKIQTTNRNHPPRNVISLCRTSKAKPEATGDLNVTASDGLTSVSSKGMKGQAPRYFTSSSKRPMESREKGDNRPESEIKRHRKFDTESSSFNKSNRYGSKVASEANAKSKADEDLLSHDPIKVATAMQKRISFPCKLYGMLEDACSQGFSHVVSWNAAGTGFMVNDIKYFTKHIVTKYFKQTKYKSFQRQLSSYGFSRVSNGPLKGLRSHPEFVRGSVRSCIDMRPIYRSSIDNYHNTVESIRSSLRKRNSFASVSSTLSSSSHRRNDSFTSEKIPINSQPSPPADSTLASAKAADDNFDKSVASALDFMDATPIINYDWESCDLDDAESISASTQDDSSLGLFEGQSFFLMENEDSIVSGMEMDDMRIAHPNPVPCDQLPASCQPLMMPSLPTADQLLNLKPKISPTISLEFLPSPTLDDDKKPFAKAEAETQTEAEPKTEFEAEPNDPREKQDTEDREPIPFPARASRCVSQDTPASPLSTPTPVHSEFYSRRGSHSSTASTTSYASYGSPKRHLPGPPSPPQHSAYPPYAYGHYYYPPPPPPHYHHSHYHHYHYPRYRPTGNPPRLPARPATRPSSSTCSGAKSRGGLDPRPPRGGAYPSSWVR